MTSRCCHICKYCRVPEGRGLYQTATVYTGGGEADRGKGATLEGGTLHLRSLHGNDLSSGRGRALKGGEPGRGGEDGRGHITFKVPAW